MLYALRKFDEVKEAEIRARVSAAAEVKPYVMTLCDKLRVLYVNREMLGLEPDQCVGLGFDDIYKGPVNVYLRGILKRAKGEPRRPVPFEMSIPTVRGLCDFDEEAVFFDHRNEYLITGFFKGFSKSC